MTQLAGTPKPTPQIMTTGTASSSTFLLFLLFLTLKLTGVIAWSWWWITAPIWGPAALVLLVILGMVIAANIADYRAKKAGK